MRPTAFLQICAGIFLLAVGYGLSAQGVRAQSGSEIAGFAVEIDRDRLTLITTAGDVYETEYGRLGSGASPLFIGNFWGSGTPAEQSTLGRVRARWGER